jgi:serine/threonine protein kinase HipA of HipAB toxin-antitoxin module
MTAMQDLKEDLQETINTAKDALLEIENVGIRIACQEVVRLTLKNIIKRIDDELLQIEKQQIIDAYDKGDIEGGYNSFVTGKQYYNETYNKQ